MTMGGDSCQVGWREGYKIAHTMNRGRRKEEEKGRRNIETD